MTTQTKLPSWFKQRIPDLFQIEPLKKILKTSCLHTVCEEARCPNMGVCWSRGVATFMILGDVCTRSCRFCAVKSGEPKAPDRQEPLRVAVTVKELNLEYVVITSVTRDDLPDKGCGQFSDTICSLKETIPEIKVEALIPDFLGDKNLIERVVDSGVDVIAHNMETVHRLSRSLRPQANYETSLNVLKIAKQARKPVLIKSGFMVGLGESLDEVKGLMEDLVNAGCDILTIGQYLAPSKMQRHVRVERFVPPDEFETYKEIGASLGFKHIFSAPLVRSSYCAKEAYQSCLKTTMIGVD